MRQTTLPLSDAELVAEITILTEEEKALRERISWLTKRMNAILDEQAKSEGKLREILQHLTQLKNTQFTRAALPCSLLAARKLVLAKLKEAQREDITRARAKVLEGEIADACRTLTKSCAHPFVFSYDGSAGSRSYDYDDAHYGHRVCTLCNCSETSQSTREDQYDILVDDGTRLVRRDLRRENISPTQVEWFSVEFLQRLFEGSSSSSNVVWSESIFGNVLVVSR